MRGPDRWGCGPVREQVIKARLRRIFVGNLDDSRRSF